MRMKVRSRHRDDRDNVQDLFPFRAQARMASLTIENYVKAIYKLGGPQGDRSAATGAVAEELRVSPGTVTSMLKTLSEGGLAEYVPYEGARLTEQGKVLALRVVRRHRLIELFLVQTLGLSWDEVHEEAENMEHAVSDLLIDRIDAFLGRPAHDPHGDPIPKADGTVAAPNGRALSELVAGDKFKLVRVTDQSADFLRYLNDLGLQIGSEGELLSSRREAGVVTFQVRGEKTTVARAVADKLLVI